MKAPKMSGILLLFTSKSFPKTSVVAMIRSLPVVSDERELLFLNAEKSQQGIERMAVAR